MASLRILLLFVAFYLCFHPGHSQTYAPTARTIYGSVQGMYQSVSVGGKQRTVSAFLGIPFARPPTGQLRFAAPRQPFSWDPDVKRTVDFGNSCFHDPDTYFPGFPGAEMWNAPNNRSEDCLYLNVWTPLNLRRKSEPLAVMVWIYGGSFFSGTSALPVYDGRYLAADGHVIVVSINYRLGPLGFLPPLAGEFPGNAGLMDQQMGLKWVRDNIREFGGNPNNVTLFGESAGAASISLHTVAPSSRGLFNRVILQSGNQLTPWATVSLDTALGRTRRMAANLQCPEAATAAEWELLSCLRSKTAAEVFAASWVESHIFVFPFVPVRGTAFLPQDPREVSERGLSADIDMMAGYNTNEGSYFTIYVVPGFNISTESFVTRENCGCPTCTTTKPRGTWNCFHEYDSPNYSSRAKPTEEQYVNGIKLCGLATDDMGYAATDFLYSDWSNPNNPAQYRDGLNNIVSDYHIDCPTKSLVKLQSQLFPDRKVYLYHLDYRLSNNRWPQWAGVMHGYEIELVFGLPMFGDFEYARGYSDLDRVVSRRVVRYWTNFAKHGNPNGFQDEMNEQGKMSDDDFWPAFDSAKQNYLEISDSTDFVRQGTTRAMQCAFWEHYIPSLTLATSEMDEVEKKWKMEFHRWSQSMDSWDRAFRTYSKAEETDGSACRK